MRNLRIDLCYDGTRYRGWQRLPGTDMTIQGKLERALSRILDEPIEVTGSGRTDAGVHAMYQVANFHCQSSVSSDEILLQLRRYMPEDIGIYSCKDVSPRFHARLSAKEKTYRYRIWNSDLPCVFDRRYVTVDSRVFDISAMVSAADILTGTHDFSAFCANPRMKKSTIRSIRSIEIEKAGNELVFTVTGNGFLHNMMRILVGTLLEVGIGERSIDSIEQLFGAPRACAGRLMSASGLCLMEVLY